MNINMNKNHEKIMFLQLYFGNNGLLLCNENKDLPSLDTVGGDWNSIVSLIEQGEVFYSKLYKGRVSYLSQELYYQIKPYKQRTEKLTVKSKEILDFIEAAGLANTQQIKNTLMLSAKVLTACMDELFTELFVTATQRDRTMNDNWCSFRWGTFEHWEKIKPLPEVELDITKINKLLSAIMTHKQIQTLLK